MDEIIDLLGEEIKEEIQNLSTLEPGSKEKSMAIEDLTKLYRLGIEELNKKDQLNEQVKDRYFRVGIAAAELLIPLMCYGIWMNKGFKFEETGTFTSSTFKGLINRFRPTKK